MSEGYRLLLAVTSAIEAAGFYVMYRGFAGLRRSASMSPQAAKGFSNAAMGAQLLAICYGLSLAYHLVAILFPEAFQSPEVYSVLRMINIIVLKAGKILGMLVLMGGWAKVKSAPAPAPPACETRA